MRHDIKYGMLQTQVYHTTSENMTQKPATYMQEHEKDSSVTFLTMVYHTDMKTNIFMFTLSRKYNKSMKCDDKGGFAYNRFETNIFSNYL
jgi:hypothetical protein